MNKSGCATLTTIFMLFVAGCGGPRPVEEQEQSLLFLRSPGGVALVEPGAPEPAYRDAASVPSRDWSTVVRTRVTKGTTLVSSVDPATGEENWTRTTAGRLRAKTVSDGGDFVALGPLAEAPYRAGRRRTRLTIMRGGAADAQSLTLDGNYEPEAFSTDGNSLFVISYLPARNPTKYQVRRLDLNTGKVKGVYTPHEELQEAMGGTARIQADSPDGKRLYTLYTVGRGDDRYAFIHVLSLDELWAHCIALPSKFARSADSATTLTVSPDGKHLYAANSVSKILAEVDTESLRVARTAPVEFGNAGSAHSLIGSRSTLYVAAGRHLTAIDTSDLTERGSWRMEERVTGLQESADAKHLYVGLRRQVAIVDPDTGGTLENIDPPGVGRIDRLGPTGPPVEDDVPKEDLTCAC